MPVEFLNDTAAGIILKMIYMKFKTFFVCAVVAALSACGSGKRDNNGDSEHIAMDSAVRVDDAGVPASMSHGSENYRIENGKIIPANGRPLIVDFSATWCPPCRELKPVFENLEKEYSGKVDFASVDVDENGSLAEIYEVSSIPCLVFISSSGEELGRVVGYQTREQLKEEISSHFAR